MDINLIGADSNPRPAFPIMVHNMNFIITVDALAISRGHIAVIRLH